VSLRRNLSAGLAGSAWSAAIGLLAVPIYLELLGAESYGLIGFFATSQALMQIMDLGLSPTLSREVARAISNNDPQSVGNLVKSTTRVYWLIAVLLFCIFYLFSNVIASNWIKNIALTDIEVRNAIVLMGIVIAVKWPMALYGGILIGAERQSRLAIINIANVTVSTGGAILLMHIFIPSIHLFFIWQAAVMVIFVFIYQNQAWKVIGTPSNFKFSFAALVNIWKFSAGMNGVALTSLALSQLDKLILSKILPLATFGHYMVAIQVASAAYLLLTPVFNVIYPKISGLIVTSKKDELLNFYRSGTKLLIITLCTATLFVGFNSTELVYLWTGNMDLANEVGPVIVLLLVGTTFNGAMHFPYALQLANGTPQISFIINCILVTIMAPLTYILAIKFGAIGGGLSWAALNLIYLFLGTFITHKYILIGVGTKWLFVDVVIPLVLVITILSPPMHLIQSFTLTPILHIVLSVLLIAFVIALLWGMNKAKLINIKILSFFKDIH
jgi:O-antigen/teichoic acid export membrane protein